MLKKLTLCMLIGLASIQVWSQPVNIDSLKSIWSDETKADSTRLQAIYKLSRDGFVFTQPDSAIFYAKLHYALAEEKNDRMQMALALNTQGEAHYGKGNYDQAYEHYNGCLQIAEEVGDQRRIASSLNNIGLIHELKGDYIKALEVYGRALGIFETIDFQLGVVGSLNNIGVVYQIQGDYVKAIEYYSRSLKEVEELGNERFKLTFLNNIGLVHQHHNNLDKAITYFSKGLEIAEQINYPPGMAFTLNNLGSAHESLDQYTEALSYFERCLDIRNTLGDQQGQVLVLANIGAIYQRQGQLDLSMNYHKKSLKIAEEIGYQQGIASVLSNIGTIYLLQNDTQSAIAYGNKSLSKAEEIGAIQEIKAASEHLYKAYQQAGNHRTSLEMYKLYIDMRDSIENIAGQKETLQQEFKRQLAADSLAFAKQREMDALKLATEKQKAATQKFGMLAGFVFVLFVIGVYFRISHIKKVAERTSLLNEIKLLKVEAVIKTAANPEVKEQLTLDKEKIEAAIKNSLNASDWNILTTLYDNPAIGNRQLADVVSLSVAGVRSSLQKMYRYFYIDPSANQRMLLVMEATKISNNSLTDQPVFIDKS